jgi:hypothetical protein
MAYYPKEKKVVLTGQPLTNGGSFTFDRFQLDGLGLRKIRLWLSITTDVGAADPITWGAYQYIKGVWLHNDRDEYYFKGVPGMSLFRTNSYRFFDGCQPYHQPILAAAGTYLACLDLPLVYPGLFRPEDTIVETKNLNRLTLELSLGTISDILVTPGANVLTATLGIEVIGTRASIGVDKNGIKDPNHAKAYFYAFQQTYPMHHADVQRYWDLDAASDVGILGWMMYNHGASGLPFIGSVAAPGNDHITNVRFGDINHQYLTGLSALDFQQARQEMLDFNRHGADLVSPITRLGEYPHLFVQDGSVSEGYQTTFPAKLEYDNATATDETDLVVWGVRTLRG